MSRTVSPLSDGVYLGQLVMAAKHYEVGQFHLPLPGRKAGMTIGEPYCPSAHPEGRDYGYQRNGFFVLVEASLAKEVYADGAFPRLRPRPGESGFGLLDA